MAASNALISRGRVVRTSKGADKSSPSSPPNFIERLPSEILIKILSYLNASALFSISHINKLFNRLANDNHLWKKIYIREIEQNKKQMHKFTDELLLKISSVEVHDQAAGYWKLLFFRTVAARDMKKWRRQVGLISRHTGLPSQTEKVLRKLNVTWELTVSDQSGREDTLELSCSQFFQTSVTLCWSGGSCLPSYQHISTLQLHGVWRIALSCPGLQQPGRRSLMAKSDMQTLTKGVKVFSQDGLVELQLLQPGIIIGVWRGQRSVAFVMFTLHLHRLLERCTQGSPVCPYVEKVVKPPLDDIDPEYGLHGYQLHIVLHGTECQFMSESFSQLFCRRTQICDGLIQLTAISRTNVSQHTPVTGSITLPWRCEALQGAVENCCVMSATLLDEFRQPFWCVSSPVKVEKLQTTTVCYDLEGENYLIHYQDSDGQVKMKLVRLKEQKQFVVVSLVVYVSISKVNMHFSRDY